MPRRFAAAESAQPLLEDKQEPEKSVLQTKKTNSKLGSNK